MNEQSDVKKPNKRVDYEATHIEFLSDNVLIGLSGAGYIKTEGQPVECSKMFCFDTREKNKYINYYHIKDYQGSEDCQEFISLSCNKNNKNEFVAGTLFDGKVFDIRKMKKPVYSFAPNDSLKPREFLVSWSPSGKYIFVSARFHARYVSSENDGLCPDDYTNSFWDVINSERVDMHINPILIPADACSKWKAGSQTWINDNLVVGAVSNITTIDPYAKKVHWEHIYDDVNNSCFSNRVSYNGFAYNNKTLQLAGADEKNIFIWSHYKLPPYKCTRIYSNTDDSDDEFDFDPIS